MRYISISEDFPIPSLEDRFGHSDALIMDENVLCHRNKFLSENNVSHIKWPPWCPNISSDENIFYILKNMLFKL